MDFWYVWASSGSRQKLCFLFLLVVAIVAAVRATRSVWWRWRATRDADAAALTARRRALAAASTRGLTESALAFTCAGTASGLITGANSLGNSGRNGFAILAEQWLDSLALASVAGMLCAILVVVAWAGDPGWRDSRPSRVVVAIGRGRQLLWPAAIVLTVLALWEMRGTYEREVARVGEPLVSIAAWVAIGQLWLRLEMLFTAVGVLAWLSVLVESAAARRCRVT